MVKKTTSGRDPHTRRVDGKVDTFSAETHQQVFARLSKVKQGEMHGAPGLRRPKQK